MARNIIKADDIHDALAGRPVKAHKAAREAVEEQLEQMQLVFLWEVKPERKHFAGVASLAGLRERYKELVQIHHPDRGGSHDIMAAINAEHDARVSELASKGRSEDIDGQRTAKAAGMTDKEVLAAIAAEFKAAMEALASMDLSGVTVELIGSWLWVQGDTKKIKDDLKAAGFRWARKKAAFKLELRGYGMTATQSTAHRGVRWRRKK